MTDVALTLLLILWPLVAFGVLRYAVDNMPRPSTRGELALVLAVSFTWPIGLALLLAVLVIVFAANGAWEIL